MYNYLGPKPRQSRDVLRDSRSTQTEGWSLRSRHPAKNTRTVGATTDVKGNDGRKKYHPETLKTKFPAHFCNGADCIHVERSVATESAQRRTFVENTPWLKTTGAGGGWHLALGKRITTCQERAYCLLRKVSKTIPGHVWRLSPLIISFYRTGIQAKAFNVLE